MKVIIGTTSFDAAKQAQELLKARSKIAREKGALPLVGVAEHRAHYIKLCDDCGLNFWNTDEYNYSCEIHARSS